MKQFDVTGMTCAACSARVEKAVCAVSGVTACSVSLLTNSMSVEGDASFDEIIKAVERAGYKASEKGDVRSLPEKEDIGNQEEKELKIRLVLSCVLLLVLMYFSMGHTMAGFPVPSFLYENYIGLGLLQLLLSFVVLLINKRFFINGIKGVFNKAPNMDTLVAMGSGISFIYSIFILFRMTYSSASGDASQLQSLMHGFYFESAAMIVTLITVGKMLEARSKGKTTNALKSLIALAPSEAVVIRNSQELTVDISEVIIGDEFIVRPGESIPADGIVIKGESAVDEAALTGESIPVDKQAGARVSAGTINTSGVIVCRATNVGKDTLLSGIIRMVSDAAATKAPVAKAADKVAGVFVPAVLITALITVAVWLLLGESAGFALARGISVLVISCPCALGLATPVAIMVGSGIGARNGVLFKTAASLENSGKIKIAALDKTGTITMGKPSVTDIFPCPGISQTELMNIAFSLEYSSEHPLARAVCSKAEEMGCERKEVSDFRSLTGHGVRAVCEGKEIIGASMSFMSDKLEINSDAKNVARRLSQEGKTPIVFSSGNTLLGIIGVADTIREDSVKAIAEMKNMGLYVVMLTGDNKITAEAIGRQAGVDKVFAEVLPDGKQEIITYLQQSGLTAMVGDGINDAPALTKADVGIAIGAGTDVAIDAADVVLIKSSLYDAVKAIRLGRAVLKNIYQNLFWAFGYNIIGIPLAAGVFIGALGWSMNPMFGAAAMSISSILVVSNALRLNFRNISTSAKDKKIKKVSLKEEKIMTKTMKIEGMMCMHCEARVKKTLEAIDGVSEALVSHESGTAKITLSKDVSDDELCAAIENQDYTVLGIE